MPQHQPQIPGRAAAWVLTLALALLAGMTLPGAPALAQDPAAPEPAATSEAVPGPPRLLQMTDQLEADIAKVVEMKGGLEAASGEDRTLLERVIRDAELKIGAEVQDLARAVLAADPAEPGLERARELAIEVLTGLAPQIEVVIAERQEAVSEAARVRDEAAPEDLLAAEQKVTTASDDVVGTLRYYLRHIELMEQFGLDATKYRESLPKLISDYAEKTAARVKITNEERRSVAKQLAAAPDNADAKRRKAVLDERMKGTVSALRGAVEVMQGVGLDTTEYQKVLVLATGDVSAIGTNVGVLTSLIGDAGRKMVEWLNSNALTILGRFAIFLAILAVFWMLSRGARRLVRRVLPSDSSSMTVLARNMLVRTAGNLVLVFGVLVALSQLGISVGPMLAGLGIAGIVIGFALQDTLSNFASGVMILLYRPFDVGDFVQAAGIEGKVSNMNLVSTTILTFDNQTLVVPNNKIWGDVIRNVTSQDKRRVDLAFGIGYDDDIEHAERVFQEILGSHPRVLEEPEPTIKLHELGDSSVNYIVRPWVLKEDYWDVYWDVTREVKRRFDEEGLTIPYPQRDVHLHGGASAPPDEA